MVSSALQIPTQCGNLAKANAPGCRAGAGLRVSISSGNDKEVTRSRHKMLRTQETSHYWVVGSSLDL